ncbi:MAG: helix-turn-helix domain-containing protein [Beijerinckiaceae bacterium]
MAKLYKNGSALASEIRTCREARGISYEKLALTADVNVAQAFRICQGDFKTLNPSVLKICNTLGVQPKADSPDAHPASDEATAALLSSEVLTAWDHTQAGAELLIRVLRALHPVAR